MNDTNDKELLKMAAKAAGIDLQWVEHCTPHACFDPASDSQWWDPLIDDGDALRLAVALFLDVAVSEIHKRTIVCSLKTSGVTIEEHEDAPGAATRRAITRASAEIGRNMT